MTRRVVHGLLLAVVLGGAAQGAPQGAGFQKGLYFAKWQTGQYRSQAAERSLAALVDTGAKWVAILSPNFQVDRTSTEIRATIDDPFLSRRRSAPGEEDITAVVNRAHKQGLKVMLATQVMLLDRSQWKGQIGETFKDDATWARWFASYRAFVLRQARLAQRLGVEQLSVGNELRAASHREAEWRALIKAVRAVYKGSLTYAAHHDEVFRIRWWDALDVIGIDAYWDLVNTKTPTVAQIRAAWAPYKQKLQELSRKTGRKVVFTEVGFRSVDGAASKPWDYGQDKPLDLQEQADAYEATFQAFFHEPWVGGFHWWAWDSSAGSGPNDRSYNPHGKPAEKVLRRWYGAQAPRPDGFRWVYRDGLGEGWSQLPYSAKTDLEAPRGRHRSLALELESEPVGGVSLSHAKFDPSRYGALELYVRGDGAKLGLQVALELGGASPRELSWDPLEHTAGGRPTSTGWTRIVLPLPQDLPAGAVPVQLSVQDVSGAGAKLLLDEVRWIESTRAKQEAGSGFDLGAVLRDAIAGFLKLFGGGGGGSTESHDGLLGALGRAR